MSRKNINIYEQINDPNEPAKAPKRHRRKPLLLNEMLPFAIKEAYKAGILAAKSIVASFYTQRNGDKDEFSYTYLIPGNGITGIKYEYYWTCLRKRMTESVFFIRKTAVWLLPGMRVWP